MRTEHNGKRQTKLIADNLLAQLSDFGLNPQDWQLMNEPWHTHSPALLESKQDKHWRLMGYLDWESANQWQLLDLQLLSL